MRVVVLAGFVLGHGDPAENLVLLDARHEHAPFDVAAKIGEGHVLLLERRLELLVVLDLVLFLELVEDALELLVAELVAELLAALHEQHLVDDVHHQFRRDLVEHLPQLRVGEVGLPDRAAAPSRAAP